jgi:geranylgeranyl diphosphate synthase, type I
MIQAATHSTPNAPSNVGQIFFPVPRSAWSVLAEARQSVLPAYQALADSLPPQTRHIIGYHAGWWDAHGRPGQPTDKYLRPAIALSTASALSPTTAQNALPAALAVQLVHDFSLIHDDIMDQDTTRRHRPAAWTVFGAGPALLAGDALLAAAFHTMAESESSVSVNQTRVLAQTVKDLCQGQCLDLEYEHRTTIDDSLCKAVIEGKTGSLLGCAGELGALAAGADQYQAAAAREFGRCLGVAFQLTDDLLGIWGDPAVTGKSARSDLARRKMTLPVVIALASASPEAAELAELYGHVGPLDESALIRAAELIEQLGGRAQTQSRAELALSEAFEFAGQIAPGASDDGDLRLLALLAARRDR